MNKVHHILSATLLLAACSAGGEQARADADASTFEATAANVAAGGEQTLRRGSTADQTDAPMIEADSGPHRGRMGVREWQRRASGSFSAIDRASVTQPERFGLRRDDSDACRQIGSHDVESIAEACGFVDRAGVVHTMLADGQVYIKTLDVLPGNSRQLAALDIGTARAMQDVLDRVRDLLPGAFVDCRTEAQTHTLPTGQSVQVSSCGAQLGDAWVTLLFGRDDEQLLRAEYHAFQAN